MSDQPDAGSLPELTPEQEEAVRRLLADARHTDPMPIEVADRLDSVLSGLTRDESGSPGVAPVIDLAARRRRRNAAALLAGAAAVIVAGFAGGQLIDVGSNDDSGDASSTEAGADRAGAAQDEAAPDENSGAGDLGTSSNPVAPQVGPMVLDLRSKHLESDLNRQLSSYAANSGGQEQADAALGSIGCASSPPVNKFGTGDLFPALYDDTPAVLALRPPADGRQQADVLDCNTAELLDSVSLAPR